MIPVMGQLSFLVKGMLLDDTTMPVLVAPLYIPLVIRLGSDPVWFGALFTVTRQIAHLTPPSGCQRFVMRAMSPPGNTPGDIYRPIVPFVPVILFGLASNVAFPRIAPRLPDLQHGNRERYQREENEDVRG